MAGINPGRWLAGGIAATIVIWVIEGAGGFIYLGPMQRALEAHALQMDLSLGGWLLSLLASFIGGMTLIFFYAAARPRFGPGPRTALIVGFALWLGGYVLSLLGYHMLGLFPPGLLITWALIGLIELLLAALVGAWVYREPPGNPPD